MYACSSGTMRASRWASCQRCNSTTSSSSRWRKFLGPVIACVIASLRRGPTFSDFGPRAAVHRERKSALARRGGSFPRSEVKDKLLIRSFVPGASGPSRLFPFALSLDPPPVGDLRSANPRTQRGVRTIPVLPIYTPKRRRVGDTSLFSGLPLKAPRCSTFRRTTTTGPRPFSQRPTTSRALSSRSSRTNTTP